MPPCVVGWAGIYVSAPFLFVLPCFFVFLNILFLSCVRGWVNPLPCCGCRCCCCRPLWGGGGLRRGMAHACLSNSWACRILVCFWVGFGLAVVSRGETAKCDDTGLFCCRYRRPRFGPFFVFVFLAQHAKSDPKQNKNRNVCFCGRVNDHIFFFSFFFVTKFRSSPFFLSRGSRHSR